MAAVECPLGHDVAGDLLGQPVLDARLRQHVLEQLRGRAGARQQDGHGQRPPAAAARQRDPDAQQAGARVGQRVAEVGQDLDLEVHAGAVERDEAVQHGGVALVPGGHEQREHAHRDQAEQADEGGEQRDVAASEHDGSRVGALLSAR